MLTAYTGKDVNNRLLVKAFENTPSIIIDCGNACNVHNLFPMIKEEQLHEVYVMNAEAIYRFRDALKQIPYWSKKLKIKQVVITTIHILYSYDDEEENYNVLEHCWQIMKEISKNIPVYVGVKKKKHLIFAQRFSDRLS